jgi:hypothetical protein
MVTNGQMQIANGMRSDSQTSRPGLLGVPGGPAVLGESAPRAGPRHGPARPGEDLERPGPDEYPLIVSLLLVKKKLRQPPVRIIVARMMAGRA